jgi:hypothetical protein
MVVNFRAHEISQDTHKLTRTPMLIKKTDNQLNATSNLIINYLLI